LQTQAGRPEFTSTSTQAKAKFWCYKIQNGMYQSDREQYLDLLKLLLIDAAIWTNQNGFFPCMFFHLVELHQANNNQLKRRFARGHL
jgi:hypothetical protein